jgi:hypothetical protein
VLAVQLAPQPPLEGEGKRKEQCRLKRKADEIERGRT